MSLKNITFLIILILSSCLGPRNIDYKKVWVEQGEELKKLVVKIKSGSYKRGINEFPDQFEYPFDDGFLIGYDGKGTNSPIDTNSLTIRFYTDRGLLDHFSSFIYTNDNIEIEILNHKSNLNNNDQNVKLENNWYYIKE
jgi:hypothetical protein